MDSADKTHERQRTWGV